MSYKLTHLVVVLIATAKTTSLARARTNEEPVRSFVRLRRYKKKAM